MIRLLNKVNLMGRLTRDPELRYTASNTPVANFTLAVNRNYKQGDKRQADFIPVIAWKHSAEFVNKYFRKGQQVVVSGRLQSRTWEDNEGRRHYATEVVAEETYFAEGKRDNNHDDGYMPIDDDDNPFHGG